MISLEKIQEYIKDKEFKLEKPDKQTYVMSLDAQELDSMVKFLKHEHTSFEFLVFSRDDSRGVLRYFFYLAEPKSLLCLESKLESKEALSLCGYYPILLNYERQIERDYGVKFILANNSSDDKNVQKAYGQILSQASYIDLGSNESCVIPVGPVHAGVIEPGHFHFSALGEHIINLEIKLGYKHKAVFKDFQNKSIDHGLEIAEHLCGDSVVAYALAFVQSAEKLLGINVDKESLYLRTLVLELERLYNHIGDIGGLINDTGFAFANAHLSVLKERILRINDKYFDHRFLRNLISVGGFRKSLDDTQIKSMREELDAVRHDFKTIIKLVVKNTGATERLTQTGILSHETAKGLSVSGLVGRASGISFDIRRDLPFAAYDSFDFRLHLRHEGDVLSRFYLRYDEAQESFHIIRTVLKHLAGINPKRVSQSKDSNKTKQSFAWAASEGARGQIFSYLELNPDNSIKTAVIRDISLHNWKALEFAVLNNIVPDFPLCNKSFNLAYAGVDM